MRFGCSRITHRRKTSGFTLIELLLVVAVILVLAGITFGISRGVRNAQARAQAKAELAVIAQAIEVFKTKYGDYPWVGNGNVESRDNNKNVCHGLMKTLVGWQAVDGTQQGQANSNGVVFNKAESALDVSKLSLSLPWPNSNPERSPSVETYFVDPWGNPYVYVYKDPSQHQLGANTGPWARYGYILFSTGPDGAASSSGLDENSGIMIETGGNSDFRAQDENIDNIYYGE